MTVPNDFRVWRGADGAALKPPNTTTGYLIGWADGIRIRNAGGDRVGATVYGPFSNTAGVANTWRYALLTDDWYALALSANAIVSYVVVQLSDLPGGYKLVAKSTFTAPSGQIWKVMRDSNINLTGSSSDAVSNVYGHRGLTNLHVDSNVPISAVSGSQGGFLTLVRLK